LFYFLEISIVNQEESGKLFYVGHPTCTLFVAISRKYDRQVYKPFQRLTVVKKHIRFYAMPIYFHDSHYLVKSQAEGGE